MINKRNKMQRSNSKIRKWMILNEFKDISFFPHTRWIKDVHFQGLEFDGLASKGTQLVLFQAKSNCKISKAKLEEYRAVSEKYGIICLWANCIDKKGVEIYQ